MPFVSLRVDDTTIIDLLQAERTGENVNHVAFVVEDVDLDELAASGTVEVDSGPADLFGARGIGRGLYIRDPDAQPRRAEDVLTWTSGTPRSRRSPAWCGREEVSATELTQAALDRIDAVNPTINAFVAVDPDLAPGRRRAGRRRAGRRSGPRAAGRHPDRREGPRGRHRVRDDPGLAAPPGRRPGRGRLRLREPAAGRRVRRGRQDEHPGARREGPDLQPALRDHPEPVGPRSHRRADRRAVPRPRWPPGWSRWPRGRTAAARSASRRRCAG